MGLARDILLWISENKKLRETLPNYRFIRRAVRRFMPGEKLEDAIRAAVEFKRRKISTILTYLGENITDRDEAEDVAKHYIEVIKEINRNKLDSCISVKLTHLGLDLGDDLCLENLLNIVENARSYNNWVWIDMEQSQYVDRTISTYKDVRSSYSKVGICLQAYLHRTRSDLEKLLPLNPAIRLVKGAYKESPSISYRKKSDVDRNFLSLAVTMLENLKRYDLKIGIATHDKDLIRRIIQEARRRGISDDAYEFQMLYGIKTEEQYRLADEGFRVRVLISYGSYWFPWYMRRLAERPANVMFVLRNLIGF